MIEVKFRDIGPTDRSHIWYIRQDEIVEDKPREAGYYWTNEIGLLGDGVAYATPELARESLWLYARLLGESLMATEEL